MSSRNSTRRAVPAAAPPSAQPSSTDSTSSSAWAEIHQATAHLILIGKLLQLAGSDTDGTLETLDAEDIFTLGAEIERCAREAQIAGETLDAERAKRNAEAANG